MKLVLVGSLFCILLYSFHCFTDRKSPTCTILIKIQHYILLHRLVGHTCNRPTELVCMCWRQYIVQYSLAPKITDWRTWRKTGRLYQFVDPRQLCKLSCFINKLPRLFYWYLCLMIGILHNLLYPIDSLGLLKDVPSTTSFIIKVSK